MTTQSNNTACDAGSAVELIAKAWGSDSDDRLAVRSRILSLQETMLAETDLHIECPVKHTFAPGVYAREIFMPKDSVVIGKIHRHAHINIVSRGKVSVVTEFGPQIIDATEYTQTFVSLPGTKRAVHILEDTTWTTIHLTNETDLAKIEEEIIAKAYDELEQLEASVDALRMEGS